MLEILSSRIHFSIMDCRADLGFWFGIFIINTYWKAWSHSPRSYFIFHFFPFSFLLLLFPLLAMINQIGLSFFFFFFQQQFFSHMPCPSELAFCCSWSWVIFLPIIGSHSSSMQELCSEKWRFGDGYSKKTNILPNWDFLILYVF